MKLNEGGIRMKKKIITISRQFGSGGRGIGKLLADRLDIPFYDKELIELASKESGIDERIFKSEGEETGRFYQVLGAIGYALGSPAGGIYEYSINDQLYLVQANIIEQLANEGPCVIVGRCADYVLADREDVLNIYLCADMDERLRRVIDEYHVEDADEAMLCKVDKRRSNYYQYYTDRVWGKAENYDLCINTGKFDTDAIIGMIVDAYRRS